MSKRAVSTKRSTILPPSCKSAVQRSKRMRGSPELCLASRTPSSEMVDAYVRVAGYKRVIAVARTLRGPL